MQNHLEEKKCKGFLLLRNKSCSPKTLPCWETKLLLCLYNIRMNLNEEGSWMQRTQYSEHDISNLNCGVNAFTQPVVAHLQCFGDVRCRNKYSLHPDQKVLPRLGSWSGRSGSKARYTPETFQNLTVQTILVRTTGTVRQKVSSSLARFIRKQFVMYHSSTPVSTSPTDYYSCSLSYSKPTFFLLFSMI